MRDRKRTFGHVVVIGLAGFCWLASCGLPAAAEGEAVSAPTAPPTPTKEFVETLHGQTIADPYHWLEDQWSTETRRWIDAQNVYTRAVLDPLPGREAIADRLRQLLKVDEISLPTVREGRYFFLRRPADRDLALLFLRHGPEGEDELLIDPHRLSDDHTVSISLLDVSDDGRLLAYGVRRGGEDELEVRFFDVDARHDVAERLPRARYFGVEIAHDKKGVFYTRHDESGSRVFYHVLGEEPNGDRLLFGEGYGPGKIIAGELSDDGAYLLLTVYYGSAAKQTELHLLQTADVLKRPEVRPIVRDIEARFEGQIADGRLFLFTNYEAPNGRVLMADLERPQPEHWQELIPEQEAILQSVSLVGRRVAARYLDQVRSRIALFDVEGNLRGEIRPEQIGSIGGLSGRWQSNEAFYTFRSFHLPPTIYRCAVEDGHTRIWARQEVPIDSNRFLVKQVRYTSKDGTPVPMFLVHRKDVTRDGKRPTLLTAYGGFNISLTPRFSPLLVVWMEYGGVVAVPNLRGGGEFGERWHQAGMLEHKQNVFDDFIAAAEWLIEHHYTSPDKLAIRGASNGGLLVGAAMTQRPELFRAVVCRYPLLDMLRYHRFLVARFWVPEYGSAEDPEQFEYLRAYSPYHNVRPDVRYPAVLLVTGDADTRVDPLHARKMAALLQRYADAERPVLLRYDTKAGHSRGSTPVPKRVEEMTDELAFLFAMLGAGPATSADGGTKAAAPSGDAGP